MSGTIVVMQISHSPHGEDPTPEQIASWTRRMSPPENEVPGAVPWSALLGRSTDVAVALVGTRAYSTGLQLDVAVRARYEPRSRDEALLHQGAFGYLGGDGVDQLLLGVEYADGRVATNVAPSRWPPHDHSDDEPSLHPGGTSGHSRGVDVEFFLSPLPPVGPFTIFCAWPSQGIPETRTVLDGAALTEAVTQIQVLWPIAPPPEPAPPPPPNVPPGGWFEVVLRPDPQ